MVEGRRRDGQCVKAFPHEGESLFERVRGQAARRRRAPVVSQEASSPGMLVTSFLFL